MAGAPTPPSPHHSRDINRERVGVDACVSSDEQAYASAMRSSFARGCCDLHRPPTTDLYADEGVSGTVPVPEHRQARACRTTPWSASSTCCWPTASTAWPLDPHPARHRDPLRAQGDAARPTTDVIDTSSALGTFIMALLGSLAARERATLVARMRLGRHRAARERRGPGGMPSFSCRIKQPEHDLRLVAAEEQAAAVWRIVHLYVHEGLGLIPLMELFNAEGVPSPYQARGQKTRHWPDGNCRGNTGTLSHLPRNAALGGRHRAGARVAKEIGEYETPRSVDDESFRTAQRLSGERFICRGPACFHRHKPRPLPLDPRLPA